MKRKIKPIKKATKAKKQRPKELTKEEKFAIAKAEVINTFSLGGYSLNIDNGKYSLIFEMLGEDGYEFITYLLHDKEPSNADAIRLMQSHAFSRGLISKNKLEKYVKEIIDQTNCTIQRSVRQTIYNIANPYKEQ